METPSNATPIEHRIREGLSRVSSVLRSDEWSRAKQAGLNPTQYAILEHLDGRPEGLSVQEVAFHLGVSQPTATDSIAAIERKGLVARRQSPEDRRVVRVLLTRSGSDVLREGDRIAGTVQQAASSLRDDEQESLLLTLVSMIRRLQETDAIPIQRMCVSCRYFDPFAHADAARPHHCNFVNAAFGQSDLRIECREHETADPAVRAATWTVFDRDRNSLQANEKDLRHD